MRPIPATSLGHAHGLLRAIDKRGRLRTDEFVTEFSLEELFPPDLENALGRLRHFISYGRAAGLVKEDRGVVELTDIGRRYIRAGDADAPFDISSQQAEWLRRQLREKHMTDSIFHGLAIGLSLLASSPPPSRVSTMDFGRSMAYLGRAGWDNDNTLLIQGERHLLLLQDIELIDHEHGLTPAGDQLRGELTLPVHMGLIDLAAQLNPGGATAVREAAEEEWAVAEPEAPPAEPEEAEEGGYETVGPWAVADDEPPRPPIVPRANAPHWGPPGDRLAPREGFSVDPPSDATMVSPPPAGAAPDPAAPMPAPAEPVESVPPGPAEPVSPPPVASSPAAAAPPGPIGSSAPATGSPAASSSAPADSSPPPAAAASSPVPAEASPPPGPSPAPAESSHPAAASSSGPVEASPPPGSSPESPPTAAAGSPPPVVAVPPAGPPPLPSGPTPASSGPAGPPRPNLTMMQPMRVVPSAAPAFVDAGAIRAAAEAAGLRLPDAVYANVAAALNAGKHLLLTGRPGAGKTWLALAVTRAAAQAGKARGATVITGAPKPELVVDAASRGRWVIVDELDQADPDEVLSPLSSFLAGVPVTLDNEEATPADGWRLVATWNGEPPRAAILRRFALVEVQPPEPEDLRRLLQHAANGDAAAVGAAERLAETGLGTGVLLDAARHAAARNAAAPADEQTLAREVFDAYAAPLQDP